MNELTASLLIVVYFCFLQGKGGLTANLLSMLPSLQRSTAGYARCFLLL